MILAIVGDAPPREVKNLFALAFSETYTSLAIFSCPLYHSDCRRQRVLSAHMQFGNSMRLTQLIERLHQQLPTMSERQIACLAMLYCDRDPHLNSLQEAVEFSRLVDDIQLRMQSIDDQHAAVVSELDELASSQPCEFEPKHVWTLIRAIKVQSQFVDMLTGSGVPQLT